MAYKIKSMLKQTSGTGLSVNYYLKQELNKFPGGDLEVTNPSNEGKSIAKVTEKFTTPKILKSKKSARDRDEKKQVREAGREAARNTDVDFVKATPMGSDYFSLMAATAENLASRGAGKRKARKEAKSLKRERLSEGRDVKPMDRKGILPLKVEGVKKIQTKKTTPSASNEDTKVPKKVDMPDMTDYIESKRKKAQYDYDQKKQETKEDSKDEINTKFIETLTKFPQKTTEVGEGVKKAENLDPKYYYKDGTPRRSVKTHKKTGKEYVQINPSPAARAIGETVRGVTDSIVDAFTATFSTMNTPAERKAKIKQARQKDLQRQEESKLDLQKIKQIQGLQMMGDGFNKGMSRKNKYKK